MLLYYNDEKGVLSNQSPWKLKTTVEKLAYRKEQRAGFSASKVFISLAFVLMAVN